MVFKSLWSWSYWWPVRKTDQMVFAEALSQALAAGLEISRAVATAAEACPRRRFRAALHEMAANCRVGYTLLESLARTGVVVSDELLAALAVGEERGDLSGSLAAFARRGGARPGARLAAAVRRRPEATRFAAALARLLQNRRLTVGLVKDAARLAAGDESAFAKAIGQVAEEMRNGTPFPQALAQQTSAFDPFFCALIGCPDGRDRLRTVLARLGELPDVEPSAAPDWPAD